MAQEPGAAPVVLTDRITPLPLGRAYALLAVLAVIGVAIYFGLRTPADSQQAATRDPSTKYSAAKEEADEEDEEEETEHPEAAAVRHAYAEFHDAMRAGNAARLKELTAAEKLEELEAEDAEEKLQIAKELYPEKATVLSVKITGDKATLTAKAKMGEQTAKGHISFVKQGSQWKVSNAAWNISITAEPEEEEEERKPRRNVARPADFPKLVGVWKGEEVGGGATWTLTFSSNYWVAARSSSGEFYEGEGLIRWDLGVEGDSIRVPPGWAPLDIEVEEASQEGAVGKVVLAAFTVNDTELKVCGGAPGHRKRVRSFESPGAGFRCMVLSKTGDAPPAKESDDSDEEEALEPPSTEGNGPGEATLLLDGIAEKYILKVGFFYDTKLKDPTQATLHFEHPAPKNSNARRILLTLDATQRGRHSANGQDIHDSMFNDKPVKVGEMKDGARAAILKWQADGGQVFPPKIGTTCEINVVSPYTGEADSELVITIGDCPIHSAGIDRTLGNVKLKVRGKIDR